MIWLPYNQQQHCNLLSRPMFLKRLLKPSIGSVVVRKCQKRSVSILGALNSSPVLVSSDRDVYTNLALEHWLYTNLRFNPVTKTESNDLKQAAVINFNHPIVFIWTDEPCIVIGRHQNPWVETHLDLVNKLGIKLARRHSGGGCVYHDESNINISIIGDRKIFENRQDNLRFLASVLEDKYQVKCEPNKRHDLIHSASGLKMSGSAAKLGRFNSYHHFTLLVDTDKEIMQATIRQKQQDFIDTNSSVSTRSSVVNLSELKSDLGVERVISDLTQAYGKRYKVEGGKPPTEGKAQGDQDDFKSLQTYRDELTSWNWIYGMTPKFKLERSISLLDQGEQKDARLGVHVNRGLFEKFQIDCDLEKVRNLSSQFDHLIGSRFTHREAIVNIVKMLQLNDNDLSKSSIIGHEQIFATFLLQMVQEANV